MSTRTLKPKRPRARSPARPKSPASQFERYDTIRTSKIAIVGFIAALLMFCGILTAQAVFFSVDHVESERKAEAAVATPLTDSLISQETQLGDYAWVDRDKGVVQIPVAKAMNQIVKEQQKAQGKEVANAL